MHLRHSYGRTRHANKLHLFFTYICVQRKTRIDTIRELYLREVRIPKLPPIPESYRTILESIYVQELALHKVEIGWTKWECLRKVGICRTK